MPDRFAPNLRPPVADAGAVCAVVQDPVVGDPAPGWQVGFAAPPTALDPVAARAARLEARLAVYAQYAAVVAEEAAATVAGDGERRSALRAARGAAAEHFTELREASPRAADAEVSGAFEFADALTDALHELRHHQSVDAALARRLRALHDAAAQRGGLLPTLASAPAAAPHIDVRF